MNFIDRVGAPRPTGRPLRLVRSIAAALTCVLAAAGGHHAAGGQMAGLAVVTVFVGAAAIAWMLSARRVTTGQIIGLLLLCQVSVHLTGGDMAMSMDSSMVLGHIAATVLSVLALAHGEKFVWHLAERLGLRLRPLHLVPVVAVRGRQLPPVAAAPVEHNTLLCHSRWLRGPPNAS